jgi:hypothetical protein
VNELLLVFDAVPLGRFVPLLLEGVGVEVPAGYTAGRLLRERLGLSAAEIEERVGTVCVDGHPLDDLDGQALGDGSRIALSGALPGLVGACLRRGSPLASLRSSISSREAGHGEEGTVTLRLFNLVLPLLGPRLLEQGVVVGGEVLTSFLASRPEQFWLSARAAALDGRALSLPLSTRDYGLLPEGPVRFVVRATASQPSTDTTTGTGDAHPGQAVRHIA